MNRKIHSRTTQLRLREPRFSLLLLLLTKVDLVDGRSEGLRRVAVEGVQDLGLDLRDGVAVEDLDLHLLLVLLGVHGQRLRRGETRERGRERVSIKSNNNGLLSANYSLYSLIFF